MRGDGGIYRRGRVHWIRYYRRGVEFYESSVCRCAPEAPQKVCKTATAMLRQRLAQIRTNVFVEPKAQRTTVAQVIDAYLANCITRGVKSLRVVYDAARQPAYIGSPAWTLAHAAAAFGTWRAVDLTDAAIERWANAMAAEGAMPGTVDQRLRYLKAAFALAFKRRTVSERPRFPTIEVRNARQGFFEAADFWRVQRMLRDPMGDVAHFAYITGWRASEVRMLTWKAVDRSGREVRLADSKNGRPRVVPIFGELVELIEKRWKARAIGCPHVFHRAGKPLHRESVTKEFSAACRSAGLGGRIFHDLRRTAYRNLLAASVDIFTAMDICGHRSQSLAKRYAITNTKNMAAALERLAAANTDRTPTAGGGAG